MAIVLGETSIPAKVLRDGSQQYLLAGGERVQIRLKLKDGDWAEEIEYRAPNNKNTRLVVTLFVEEV